MSDEAMNNFTPRAQQVLALESREGRPRLYVTAAPSVNLTPYINTNREVDLWGSVEWRPDLRAYHMVVTSVQPAP